MNRTPRRTRCNADAHYTAYEQVRGVRRLALLAGRVDVVGAGKRMDAQPTFSRARASTPVVARFRHDDGMIVTLIASVARNGVIGRDGDLAWRDRDDLQRVKQLTLGRPLVMGRRTFDSIGRPLPGRRMIVVSRRTGWAPEGVTVVGSIDEAMSEVADDDEVIGFGGGEIYSQLLDRAYCLEITEIAADLDGDVYFPKIDSMDWCEVARVQRDGFSWVTYHRAKCLDG